MCCFLHREDYGLKVGDTNKKEEEEGDNEDEMEENAEYEEGLLCNSFMPLSLNF